MKFTTTPTTAQSLGALLKSARDIMRKDEGLNGGLSPDVLKVRPFPITATSMKS